MRALIIIVISLTVKMALAKDAVNGGALSGSLSTSTYTNTLSSDEIVTVSGLYELGLAYESKSNKNKKQVINLNLGYLASYTHEFEGDRAGDFADPLLGYTIVLGNFGVFKSFGLGASLLIPVNKETRSTSMYGSLGLSLGYTFDFGFMTLNQKLGYRRTEYEYDTDLVGKINKTDSISLKNIINLILGSKLGLSVIGNYTYSQDYYGVTSSGTEIGASLNLKITKNVSTSIGFITKSGTLAATGDYHRINAYDSSRANGFWDLVLVF